MDRQQLINGLLCVTVFLVLAGTSSGQANDGCIDFEGETVGKVYNTGSMFTEDGTTMMVEPFTSLGGQVILGGSVRVADQQSAGHSGNDLVFNNATLSFDYPCVSKVTMQYGHFGGNVNLTVNGELANVAAPADLDGLTLGSVTVVVVQNSQTNGIIRLCGNMTSFSVGGQEFALDHICAIPCDDPDYIDFEELVERRLIVGDSVSEDDIRISLEKFTFSNGDTTDEGSAIAGLDGHANHAGQELCINNVLVRFGIECAREMRLHFADLGGNVNVEINNQLLNVTNLRDLDGTVAGGAIVEVNAMPTPGGTIGLLTVTGDLTAFAIGGQEFYIDHVCFDPCLDPEDCIDFEELAGGARFAVDDSFSDDGVTMTVRPFTWSNGTVFAGGRATVDTNQLAGHQGQDVNLNNVNLEFGINCADAISFKYGEYGGNLNIEINREFFNFADFSELDGLTIGGATISVMRPALGETDLGMVTMTGTTITSFSVGGQELWIDHVCLTPCETGEDCIDFDEVALNRRFFLNDEFEEDGIKAVFTRFVLLNGGIAANGVAIVNDEGRAGHTGQDLCLNNIMIEYRPECASVVSFYYGEYGGNVNLTVNGELVNVPDMKDLDGMIIGGVPVTVTSNPVQGGVTGVVTLNGEVTAFCVGGQELWIDHICITPCQPSEDCIDFEEPVLGTEFRVDEGLVEDGITMKFGSFQFLGGGGTNAGVATIQSDQMAGHLGQDLNLNNIKVQFLFECAGEVTFHYGDYGGNVNFSIDGDSANVPDLADLDGTSLGGVLISVSSSPVAGGVTGVVTLTGELSDFCVGGQELWIDHVCHEPCPPVEDCIDFEEPDLGAEFRVGEDLVEDGITMKFTPFFWLGGGGTNTGVATIQGGQTAGHQGQDLNTNNINVEFDLGCAEEVTLNYADLGGNVNLSVNGDLAIVAGLIDLNGATLGGVSVSVTASPVAGGVSGILTLTGEVNEFAIGGQEFWIDHICHVPCQPVEEIEKGPLCLESVEETKPGFLLLTFKVTVSGPVALNLEKSPTMGVNPSPWIVDTSAFISPLGGSMYRITTASPTADTRMYYRLRCTRIVIGEKQ